MYLSWITGPQDKLRTRIDTDIGEHLTAVVHVQVLVGDVTINDLAIHTPTADGAIAIRNAFETAFGDRATRDPWSVPAQEAVA